MVYLINWLLSKTLSIDSEIKTWWIPNMKYFPSQSARCVFVTKQVHNSIGRTAVWLYSFILKLFSSSLTRSCCMHSEMLRLMFAFFTFVSSMPYVDAVHFFLLISMLLRIVHFASPPPAFQAETWRCMKKNSWKSFWLLLSHSRLETSFI